MVIIEFGAAENQTLDKNSLFLKFSGNDFRDNIDKIKSYSLWERISQFYGFSIWDRSPPQLEHNDAT